VGLTTCAGVVLAVATATSGADRAGADVTPSRTPPARGVAVVSDGDAGRANPGYTGYAAHVSEAGVPGVGVFP
jgi:hypothetical protein